MAKKKTSRDMVLTILKDGSIVTQDVDDLGNKSEQFFALQDTIESVSYTHLTLPTIYSV